MPKSAETTTVQIPKDHLVVITQQLLGKNEFSYQDAGILSEIDPDLSISAGLVTQSETSGELLHRFTETMIQKIIVDTPKGEEVHISPERTQTDLTALNNFVSALETKRGNRDHRDQARLGDELLSLFSIISTWRDDLTGDQAFPWKFAVESALFPKEEFMNPRFSLRMSIFNSASDEVLRRALAADVAAGGNIVATLAHEQSGLYEDSLTSDEFIRLVGLLPMGHQRIAQTTLEWVGEAEMQITTMPNHEKANPTPEKNLRLMESMAVAQWMSLNSTDRGTFLTADLIVRLRELFPEGKPVPSLSPQMMKFLIDAVYDTSVEGRDRIKKGLVMYLKVYSKMKLGVIEKWFPRISAEAIEEAKPAWQKIFSHKK